MHSSLDGLLRPRTVAVVGASRSRTSVGGENLRKPPPASLRGHRVPGARDGLGGPGGAFVPDRRGAPRSGRPRRHRRPRSQRGCGGRAVRGGRHQSRRHRERGLRRVGGRRKGRGDADARRRPVGGDAGGRAELPGNPEHRSGSRPSCHLRDRVAARRPRLGRLAVRGTRNRPPRRSARARHRHSALRQPRQRRRRRRRRPPRVLGARSRDAGHSALPRESAPPAPIPRGRSSRLCVEARRDREERAQHLGGARGRLAHRRAGHQGRTRRRGAEASRRHARLDARRAVRRGDAAFDGTEELRPARRDRDERGGTRDPHRGRVRGARPFGPRTSTSNRTRAGGGGSRGRASQSPQSPSRSDGRALRRGPPSRPRRRGDRRGRRRVCPDDLDGRGAGCQGHRRGTQLSHQADRRVHPRKARGRGGAADAAQGVRPGLRSAGVRSGCPSRGRRARGDAFARAGCRQHGPAGAQAAVVRRSGRRLAGARSDGRLAPRVRREPAPVGGRAERRERDSGGRVDRLAHRAQESPPRRSCTRATWAAWSWASTTPTGSGPPSRSSDSG